MPSTKTLLIVSTLLFVPCFVFAADTKEKKPAKTSPSLINSANTLSQQIFHAADGNKNDFLNPAEFTNAIAMLNEAIMGMANQGILGKGQAGPKPAAVSVDPDGDEKIVLGEFTAYVNGLLQQADLDYRKAKERQQAQQKKARENRQKRNRRGGGKNRRKKKK